MLLPFVLTEFPIAIPFVLTPETVSLTILAPEPKTTAKDAAALALTPKTIESVIL